MINCLTGNVKEIREQGLTLDVGGIGFAISLARTENFVKNLK